MVKRFRMIAGPNGSGKSTLVKRLREDFAVNFYDFLNADDILAQVRRDGAFSPRFPIEMQELKAYAEASTYDESVKACFRTGLICVEGDCVKFSPGSVNSYTIALFTSFLQEAAIRREVSFSQETVFSHLSKVEALRHAKSAGYRTYLYYVATSTPVINQERVANRYSQGGHDVPPDKIVSRYARSLAHLKDAIPYLSRAFFFDNSGPEMTYLGSYSEGEGFAFNVPVDNLPRWFREAGLGSRED